MNLLEQTQAALIEGGALAAALPGFKPRQAQQDMAQAIARCIESGGVLVAEAGTGTGKTYAYLVPALLSGKRALISTATKALQDQLFTRDLPALQKALNLPISLALLKGRSSYLCLQRLEDARQQPQFDLRAMQITLSKVERWAQGTKTGDMAEVPGLDERSPVLPWVTSTRDNCLGSECPRFKDCHVNAARREALGADVVVINHHLYFADVAVRESGMAELLPSVDVVVMDEAHQINETGLQFLGEVLSTGALVDLAQDLLATGIQHARGQQAWADLAGSLDHAARDLRLLGGRQNGKRAWPAASPVGIAADEWQEALDQLGVALTEAQEALAAVDAQAPELTRMRERLCEQAGRVMLFQKPRPVDRVRWLDVTAGMRLVESPLDIAPFLRAQTQAAEGEGARKAWVFTSATLGEDADLKWFKESCGLEHAQVLKVASPFDYAHQAAYFVPRDFPETSQTDAHMQAVAQLAGQVALRLGGRTLVLTTTLRALQTITDQLTDALIDTDIRVLAQGSQPKRALMDAFREAGAKEGGAVLVGSASFWEGVDVPGAALQAVIIDKLPFPPPNDPLVEARSQRLQQQGLNSFAHLHLPEAAVALKQGAGRLIRHEEDLGVLVICDRRLAVSTYGARLRQALPPMRALTSRQELMDQLDLTKNATKISVQI